MTASWQEGAKKREVRERIAVVKRGRDLEDVWGSVNAAYAVRDWRGVLKWEGRMEELLEHLAEDADCDFCLLAFLYALSVAKGSAFSPKHALSEIRLEKRRVELLGKMERFRDQGEEMCMCGTLLERNGQRQEGERYFQKARDVGAAHGFFLVEGKACAGLGEMAVSEGRHEEGLELLRNSVVAAGLSEGYEDTNELFALLPLIQVLFKTSAIGEVEPLVLRFRELTNANVHSLPQNLLCFKMKSLLFNARLHEVLCIHPPVLGTPSSCSALAFRQRR